MFIPFLPKLDAQEILESHYQCEQSRGEYEAELGMGYVTSGMSPWDATLMARQDVDRMAREFDESPEGERYAAQVEAAEFMSDVITSDMRVYSLREVMDMEDSAYKPFMPDNPVYVPEYSPDYSRSDFTNYYEGYLTGPTNDDIPF